MASKPRIYATLDKWQEDHQATMVEIKGKFSNTSISILIYPSACWSHVSPKVFYTCKLKKLKHEKPWLVQLPTGTKRKVSELVKYNEIHMNNFPTNLDLNILPLGLYDILICMDWLEHHYGMLDCLKKSILCISTQGNQTKIQGIPKKFFVRKGCKLFAVNIQDVEADIAAHRGTSSSRILYKCIS